MTSIEDCSHQQPNQSSSSPPQIPANIQVSIRIRPPLDFECNELVAFEYGSSQNTTQSQQSTHPQQQFNALALHNPRLNRKVWFNYDDVFTPIHNQQSIYQSSTKSLLDAFMLGYNITVFAYGQTGSGKTYTLGLSKEATQLTLPNGLAAKGTKSNNSSTFLSELTTCTEPSQIASMLNLEFGTAGLLQNISCDIFARINSLQQQQQQQEQSGIDHHPIASEEMSDGVLSPITTTNAPLTTVALTMTLVEIYMDDVFDLLDASGTSKVTVRDSPDGQTDLHGATLKSVDNIFSLFQHINEGIKNRTTTATKMNNVSSRSHCILTLYMTTKTVNPSNNHTTTISRKLNICDLAGSERAAKTNCQGEHLKEGIAINSSLSALSRVISSIVKKQQLIDAGQYKAAEALHIPYRESSITKLLRDSLQGRSLTLLLACLSPAATNFEESIQTCHFATTVRGIKTSDATIMKDKDSVKFEQYEKEIVLLREECNQMRDRLGLPMLNYADRQIQKQLSMNQSTSFTSEVFRPSSSSNSFGASFGSGSVTFSNQQYQSIYSAIQQMEQDYINVSTLVSTLSTSIQDNLKSLLDDHSTMNSQTDTTTILHHLSDLISQAQMKAIGQQQQQQQLEQDQSTTMMCIDQTSTVSSPPFSSLYNLLPQPIQQLQPNDSSESLLNQLEPITPNFEQMGYETVFGSNNRHRDPNEPIQTHQPMYYGNTHKVSHMQTNRQTRIVSGSRKQPVYQNEIQNQNQQMQLYKDLGSSSSSSSSSTGRGNSQVVKKALKSTNLMGSILSPRRKSARGSHLQRTQLHKLHGLNKEKRQQLIQQQFSEQMQSITQFQSNIQSLEQSLQQLTDELFNANLGGSSSTNNDDFTSDLQNSTDEMSTESTPTQHTESQPHNFNELQTITTSISQALHDWEDHIRSVEEYHIYFLQLFETAEDIRAQRTLLSQKQLSGNNNSTDPSSNNHSIPHYQSIMNTMTEETAKLQQKEEQFLQLKEKLAVKQTQLNHSRQKVQQFTSSQQQQSNEGSKRPLTSGSNTDQSAAAQAPSYLLKNITQLQSKLAALEQSKSAQFKQYQGKLKHILDQLKTSQKEYKAVLSNNRLLNNQLSSHQLSICKLRNRNRILQVMSDRLKSQLQTYRSGTLNDAKSASTNNNNNNNSNAHFSTRTTFGFQTKQDRIAKRIEEEQALAKSMGLDKVPHYMLSVGRNAPAPTSSMSNPSTTAQLTTTTQLSINPNQHLTSTSTSPSQPAAPPTPSGKSAQRSFNNLNTDFSFNSTSNLDSLNTSALTPTGGLSTSFPKRPASRATDRFASLSRPTISSTSLSSSNNNSNLSTPAPAIKRHFQNPLQPGQRDDVFSRLSTRGPSSRASIRANATIQQPQSITSNRRSLIPPQNKTTTTIVSSTSPSHTPVTIAGAQLLIKNYGDNSNVVMLQTCVEDYDENGNPCHESLQDQDGNENGVASMTHSSMSNLSTTHRASLLSSTKRRRSSGRSSSSFDMDDDDNVDDGQELVSLNPQRQQLPHSAQFDALSPANFTSNNHPNNNADSLASESHLDALFDCVESLARDLGLTSIQSPLKQPLVQTDKDILMMASPARQDHSNEMSVLSPLNTSRLLRSSHARLTKQAISPRFDHKRPTGLIATSTLLPSQHLHNTTQFHRSSTPTDHRDSLTSPANATSNQPQFVNPFVQTPSALASVSQNSLNHNASGTDGHHFIIPGGSSVPSKHDHQQMNSSLSNQLPQQDQHPM